MASERIAVTRPRVLAESLALFATSGYRSTSLERVSEKLGVTRQALYYHFRSKDEILAALFEEMMSKLETAVARAALSDEKPIFLSMLRAHLDETVQNTALVALLLHERPEINKLEFLGAARRRRDYAGLFTDAYSEGVSAGDLLDMDPWLAVNALLTSINGISWWYHGEASKSKDIRSQHRISDEIFSLLAQGCMTRTSVARR